MIGGSAPIYHSCLAERLPIPKLTVFGLRIFQRVLLKSKHPVYLWLLAFDELYIEPIVHESKEPKVQNRDENGTKSIILLNLNGIYFQKLFILRWKSHGWGIASTKKPSRGGLFLKEDAC